MVFAVPGVSGHKSDFDQVGPALARRGVAVLAQDYRTNGTADQMSRDLQALPDVVVGVNGCYYAWQRHPQSFPVGILDRRDAKILLVAAEADQTCPAWQSKKASGALQGAGADNSLVTLAGANHYAPVFHDVLDGEWVTVADSPAGRKTVQAVLEAIRSAR